MVGGLYDVDVSVLRTMGSGEARRLASKRSQLPQTKQTKRHHGRNIPVRDRLECRRHTEVVAEESVYQKLLSGPAAFHR